MRPAGPSHPALHVLREQNSATSDPSPGVRERLVVAFRVVLELCSLKLVCTAMSGGPVVNKAALERIFVESGERDRMKELLLQRLRESGWVDEVEDMCRTFIQAKVTASFLPKLLHFFFFFWLFLRKNLECRKAPYSLGKSYWLPWNGGSLLCGDDLAS